MSITGKKLNSREPMHTNSDTLHPDESNQVTNNEGYQEFIESDLPKGADSYEDKNGNIINIQNPQLPQSLFNNYHLIRLKTAGGQNYPLTDDDSASQSELYKNITASELVKNPRGASIYRAEDFLYCMKYGIIPNNRMVTLRRFPYPVFNDIFSSIQTEPDMARMIGYSDQETNKISELLSFSFGMRWKELKSSFEQMNMFGDSRDGINGFMRNALQFADPKFGKEALDNKVKFNFDPLHDSNKVYGPVDSISEMNIRDVGLNFNHDIKLTFEYQIKSINGINQKAAFMDLLGNILLACHNDAKFWGGARYWVGPKPTKYLNNLKFLSPKNFDEFLTGSTVEFKSALGSMTGPDAAGTSGNIVEGLKTMAKNALNLSLGKMLDKVGRPGIPYSNSLLTGAPTGEWHLTLGNPMNPILTIGDLILDNTTITFGDILGYDDFPTSMKIETTLKHNKPKSRAEIEDMFNAGQGRMYFKPKSPFKTNVSTNAAGQQDPTPIADLLNVAGNIVKGDFGTDALQRTGEQVWSFLKR